MVQYCCQYLLNRIDESTSGASASSWVTIYENVRVNLPFGIDVHGGNSLKLYLLNPCQPDALIKIRKSDHSKIQKSLAPFSHLVRMISHQPGGRGSWHIKLKKLKKKKVLPSSVKCACASYGVYYGYGGNPSLCVLKAGEKKRIQITKDQKQLSTLMRMLPMNMRPQSNALVEAGEIECLGTENSVDMAFKKAVATGDIIVLD